jgi:hypothetical protein
VNHIEPVFPEVALERPKGFKVVARGGYPFYWNVYQRHIGDPALLKPGRVVPIGNARQTANAAQCGNMIEKERLQRVRAGNNEAD